MFYIISSWNLLKVNFSILSIYLFYFEESQSFYNFLIVVIKLLGLLLFRSILRMQAKTITRIKLSYLLQRIVEFDNSLLLCEFYAIIILQVFFFVNGLKVSISLFKSLALSIFIKLCYLCLKFTVNIMKDQLSFDISYFSLFFYFYPY